MHVFAFESVIGTIWDTRSTFASFLVSWIGSLDTFHTQSLHLQTSMYFIHSTSFRNIPATSDVPIPEHLGASDVGKVSVGVHIFALAFPSPGRGWYTSSYLQGSTCRISWPWCCEITNLTGVAFCTPNHATLSYGILEVVALV